ncbi:hypothetical protein GCM10009745_07290 [Kribbella yunnanensis]|uniref:Uncharacterized protein n=2 Tax=Kribbellaceae TaxID=2726069 RepID=A0ABN2G9F4_9ACTN
MRFPHGDPRAVSVAPMNAHENDLQAAKHFAEQAATTAAKLKAGTYDSVAALALTSIAHSLSVLAARSAAPQD